MRQRVISQPTRLRSGLWVRPQCCRRPVWAAWALPASPLFEVPMRALLALFVPVLPSELVLVVQAMERSLLPSAEAPKLGPRPKQVWIMMMWKAAEPSSAKRFFPSRQSSVGPVPVFSETTDSEKQTQFPPDKAPKSS